MWQLPELKVGIAAIRKKIIEWLYITIEFRRDNRVWNWISEEGERRRPTSRGDWRSRYSQRTRSLHRSTGQLHFGDQIISFPFQFFFRASNLSTNQWATSHKHRASDLRGRERVGFRRKKLEPSDLIFSRGFSLFFERENGVVIRTHLPK